MFSNFEGIWVPLITPFSGDQVDHHALAGLARSLAGTGLSGFVTGATTGEGLLLEPAEVEAVFHTLRKAVPGMPVVLGLSEPVTRHAVQRAKELASLGPEGLLVTPPSYLRPSQAGIQRHFELIAQACDLPVLVYNIPYRTGVQIDVETLQALCKDPRIAGIKECGGSSERMMRLVHETPLSVLSGDDSQNFVALCLGAKGTIAAAAHILPQWHVHMYRLLCKGELESARMIAVMMQPLIQLLFAEPNPAPLKALLGHMGQGSDELRLPFLKADSGLKLELVEALATLKAQLRDTVAAGTLSNAQN